MQLIANKSMFILVLGGFLLLMTACGLAATPSPTTTPIPTVTPLPTATPEWQREGWTLTWQDEFDGDELDTTKWTHELGGHGFGNAEWQYYSDRPENSRLEDGQLIIEAHEEDFMGKSYTSARLITRNKFTQAYGRYEARLKLPYGQGIWPAFWMLGEDLSSAGWPDAGEIDIMEHIGREPMRVYGTVHGPGYSGENGVGGSHDLGEALSDDFHLFAVEWEPEEIRWYFDDILYFTVTPDDVPGEWVYDHPFFMILNLAVGGYWPGYPDETTTFPQQYIVDYVRVYER
jgi:beta-glucanase (GH16 family)